MIVEQLLSQTRQIAGDVLFPAAAAVDRADRIPGSHLDALAGAGLFGLAGPDRAGGLDADLATFCAVTEIIASGCLATAFVWLQHHSAVRALTASPNAALSAEWLERLCRGTARAGVALGGARPGPPMLRAERVPGGYRFDGAAPWVTGWGQVDVVHTLARDAGGTLIAALLPAAESSSLAATRLPLAAVHASSTVGLAFDRHFVPAELVTGSVPHEEWLAGDLAGLRPNGSLALGLTARCARLIGMTGAGDAASVTGPLDAARAALDQAGPADLPAARAAAAALAYRSAGLLAVAAGSRAVLVGDPAERLVREALFLLVFGSRPGIKASLMAALTTPPLPA